MIFGNKETFAIEADFSQGDQHLFISYCFWVGDDKIGDNSEKSLLTSELSNIEHNLQNKNKRRFEELWQYQYTDLLSYLNYEIWGVGEEKSFIDADLDIEPLKVISDYGECFDGYYCYLLEKDSFDLLIWSDQELLAKHKKIPKGQFYKTFTDLKNWIQSNTRIVLIDSLTGD